MSTAEGLVGSRSAGTRGSGSPERGLEGRVSAVERNVFGYCVRSTAGSDEDGIRESDDGEEAQVLEVNGVRGDAEGGEPERQPVHDQQEDLRTNHSIDELSERLLREHRVFFHELGEVVEARS